MQFLSLPSHVWPAANAWNSTGGEAPSSWKGQVDSSGLKFNRLLGVIWFRNVMQYPELPAYAGESPSDPRFNKEEPYGPAITLPGIHKDSVTCTRTFTAALFLMSQRWRQPKQMDEQNVLCPHSGTAFSHKMECSTGTCYHVDDLQRHDVL